MKFQIHESKKKKKTKTKQFTDIIDKSPDIKYQKPNARIIARKKLGLDFFLFFNSLSHSLISLCRKRKREREKKLLTLNKCYYYVIQYYGKFIKINPFRHCDCDQKKKH